MARRYYNITKWVAWILALSLAVYLLVNAICRRNDEKHAIFWLHCNSVDFSSSEHSHHHVYKSVDEWRRAGQQIKNLEETLSRLYEKKKIQAVSRLYFCDAVAEIGTTTSIPILLEIISAEEPELREAAILALGRIGSPMVVKPLSELVASTTLPAASQNEEAVLALKGTVIEALRMTGDANAVPVIRNVIKKERFSLLSKTLLLEDLDILEQQLYLPREFETELSEPERAVLLWLLRFPFYGRHRSTVVEPRPYETLVEWVQAGRQFDEVDDTISVLYHRNLIPPNAIVASIALSHFGSEERFPILCEIVNDPLTSYTAKVSAIRALGGYCSHSKVRDLLYRIAKSEKDFPEIPDIYQMPLKFTAGLTLLTRTGHSPSEAIDVAAIVEEIQEMDEITHSDRETIQRYLRRLREN